MTYSGQEGRGGRGGLVQQREALSRLPALLLAHRVHRLAHPPPVSISNFGDHWPKISQIVCFSPSFYDKDI